MGRVETPKTGGHCGSVSLFIYSRYDGSASPSWRRVITCKEWKWIHMSNCLIFFFLF